MTVGKHVSVVLPLSLLWACNEQILLIRQIRKSVQRTDDVTEYRDVKELNYSHFTASISVRKQYDKLI